MRFARVSQLSPGGKIISALVFPQQSQVNSLWQRMRLLHLLPLLAVAIAQKRSYDGHQVHHLKILNGMITTLCRCSELGHLMMSRTLSSETFR